MKSVVDGACRLVDLTMPPPQESQDHPIPTPSDYLGSIYHELGSIEWTRAGCGGEMLQGLAKETSQKRQ